jgi:two-component system chemotaxis response regulator CheB
MPPTFTRLLAERLDAQCGLRVREAGGAEPLEPGDVWIAPGDYHLALERSRGMVRLKLHKAPPENSCRPAADVLFRSAAESFGAHTLAVVMTGMGQDGFKGAQAVRAAGGQVLAQDEASSVVWGMPGYVANAGLADRVLPLERIGGEIVARVKGGMERGALPRAAEQ